MNLRWKGARCRNRKALRPRSERQSWTRNLSRCPVYTERRYGRCKPRLAVHRASGGSRILGEVDSSCPPLFDFLSEREVLATTCTSQGAGKLVALTTGGQRLWDAETSNTTIWPLLVRSPDGSRLAREALAISRPVSARTTLDQDDIKGQLVEILDAADGRLVLETAASPILDAGGNVAISPSGRRVAVLNSGAIQVFELLPPRPLPDSTAHPASR